MKLKTKPSITETLRALKPGEDVALALSEVSEGCIRTMCSLEKRKTGATYQVRCKYPNVFVTRTA